MYTVIENSDFTILDLKHRLTDSYPIVLLVLIILSGCNLRIASTTEPTLVPTEVNYPSAPEPHGPMIKGTISGLPEGIFATISVRKSSSASGGIIGDRENGPWEMEILYEENFQRKVIAQAEGFSVQPPAYMIYFKEGKAFLVEDGIKTNHEATNLVFTFSSLSPTKIP